MPDTLSLMAAVSLTGKSKRTLWRRLADGSLPRAPDDASGRTLVPLVHVAAEACLPLGPDDWCLVAQADQGDASAQCDVALLFLAAQQPAGAQYWLEQAARQNYPDALQWLAHCALHGWGRPADFAQGMLWLSRAAAVGHPVAQVQLRGLNQWVHPATVAVAG